MPRSIFMPPLDSVWRLTADWTPPTTFASYSNWDFFQNFGAVTGSWGNIKARQEGESTEEYHKRYHDHKAEGFAENDVRFPGGTVVIFDRYHVSHSGAEEITLRVLASPDLRIHPKKQGGKGKGKLRVYFTLAELNTLPQLEEVTDVLS